MTNADVAWHALSRRKSIPDALCGPLCREQVAAVTIALKQRVAQKAWRGRHLLPMGDRGMSCLHIQPLERRPTQAKEEREGDLDYAVMTDDYHRLALMLPDNA